MKYSLMLLALLSVSSFAEIPIEMESTDIESIQMEPENSNITVVCPTGSCGQPTQHVQASQMATVTQGMESSDLLKSQETLRISVVGQGVAPLDAASPAQAYALAKRAAIADSYRLIAEKIKGVRVDGDDLIKNMMVKRSIIRVAVKAMIRNANVVETTFKDGLCEVEMEVVLSHSDFS